jgi:hypothetical protein
MAINTFQKPAIGQTYKNSVSVSGTSYAVSTANSGGIVRFTNDDPDVEVSVTVPGNSTAPIPIGSSIQVVQSGSSSVSLVPSSGVSIRTTTGLKTRSQYSTITLVKINTDEWIVPTRSRPPYLFVQDSEPIGAEAGDLWFW